MTVRIPKKRRPPTARERLRVTHPHAAGIDVHATVHWVAVPSQDAPVARKAKGIFAFHEDLAMKDSGMGEDLSQFNMHAQIAAKEVEQLAEANCFTLEQVMKAVKGIKG